MKKRDKPEKGFFLKLIAIVGIGFIITKVIINHIQYMRGLKYMDEIDDYDDFEDEFDDFEDEEIAEEFEQKEEESISENT